METLTDIFSHVCGQNHCFPAGGVALPVCQRCLGLYVAAALTGAWIALTGLWRRGLPSWSVFVVHVAALLGAMLAGLKLWGGSPALKFAAGAWTGHVLLLWLIGGGGHLWRLSRRPSAPQRPWRTRDKAQALVALPLLAGLAAIVPRAMALGWWAWSAAVVVGAAMLAAAALGAVGAFVLAALARPGA